MLTFEEGVREGTPNIIQFGLAQILEVDRHWSINLEVTRIKFKLEQCFDIYQLD